MEGKTPFRRVAALRAEDTVGIAVKRIMASNLPALPVIDEDGSLVGVFGEREFIAASFPGYLAVLTSVPWLSSAIDEGIELRASVRDEPVRKYLAREPIVVDSDCSELALAEVFLHHPVEIVPVAAGGRVQGVFARRDLFERLAGTDD